MKVRVWAPGRVNLIGEHTDYTGGLVLPMAIQLGTTIEGTVTTGEIRLRSDHQAEEFHAALPVTAPADILPQWGRYIGGVANLLGATTGLVGTVSSDVPAGAGLSSSAALEVAAVLALRAAAQAPGEPLPSFDPAEVAGLAQLAEQTATGVPCGIMDQLASAAGVDGHALRIDCSTLEVTPVRVPESARIVVVHSGQHRRLVGSAYAERRSQCEAAAAILGPLRTADRSSLDSIEDETVRRRARHVISENARVDAFVRALGSGNLTVAGALMSESHVSLRDDFEVSTTALDDLVARLWATPGVHGARLTGAGFGGCVVALCDPGVDPRPPGSDAWIVTPSAGPTVESVG